MQKSHGGHLANVTPSFTTTDALSDSERPFCDKLTFFSFFKLDHCTDQHLGHETMVGSTN